jgi:NodT family efflux transporter outer membrane factor (OMF) lipoprotein
MTWWTKLNDPVLDQLVGRALGANIDLAVARARLLEARESLVQAQAGRLPTVGTTASAGLTIDENGHRSGNYSLGADASWETDLFGGVRRSVESARAAAQSSAYDLAFVQVSLVGDLVADYVTARLAQQRAALARQNLSIADDNLQIARWRLQAGLVSSLDVEQARGERAQIAAAIPTYEQNFSSAAYRIGILTGEPPAALLEMLKGASPLPQAPVSIAAGIPADVLRRRPDVRSAERTLAAETARIGVAEANLYPDLRLAGNIGTSGLSLGGLVDAITGNLFATLTQTIFDAGRTRSQVRSQQAAAQAALATYKKTVLTALQDVENGLVALETAQQRLAQFEVALDAAQNQAILARSEYRSGLTDFQTLLEAERSLITARDGALTSRADETLAVVQLYRALGGGWNPAEGSSVDQAR